MMSLGVPEAAVKDRGNYAQGSDVMNRTYDYSFGGHGPLAANSLRAGDRPSLKDVKQYVPQAWRGRGCNWVLWVKIATDLPMNPTSPQSDIVRLGVG